MVRDNVNADAVSWDRIIWNGRFAGYRVSLSARGLNLTPLACW